MWRSLVRNSAYKYYEYEHYEDKCYDYEYYAYEFYGYEYMAGTIVSVCKSCSSTMPNRPDASIDLIKMFHANALRRSTATSTWHLHRDTSVELMPTIFP